MTVAEAEFRRMPPVVTALLGSTAGGPLFAATPEPMAPGQAAARVVAALVMTSPDAAKTAVPVIEERLATGATRHGLAYAEMFPGHEGRAAANAPVVLIELIPAAETPREILYRLAVTRDLGFLAWSL
jgi:hypothetical protein